MILILPVVWVIFNGKITLEIVLIGCLFTAAVYLFMCKFLDYSIKIDLKLFKITPLFLAYIGLLLKEIIKANSFVIGIIFKGRTSKAEPVIVKFKTQLTHDFFRVILANSITLTPGTITVSQRGDEMIVHCLDKTLSKDLKDSVFEKKLLRMEKRWDK